MGLMAGGCLADSNSAHAAVDPIFKSEKGRKFGKYDYSAADLDSTHA